MHKDREQIQAALTNLKATLDRGGVNVDTQVLKEMLNKIIYNRVEQQLIQTTTDWDLLSLAGLLNALEQPEPKPKQTRTRKTVQ